jgi:hypothetical protein
MDVGAIKVRTRDGIEAPGILAFTVASCTDILGTFPAQGNWIKPERVFVCATAAFSQRQSRRKLKNAHEMYPCRG